MTVSLLAIDCSTERLCLGLRHAGRDWTVEEEGGARASAQALPRLLALLEAAGLPLSGLDAIAFARGPGAFTGLRTACAVAQGLALGSGKPVLPVDSLQVVAEAAWLEAGPAAPEAVWVAMDARMGELYAGAYRREGPGWEAVVPPALYELPALQARWHPAPQAVAGSALAAFGERLSLPPSVLRLPAEGRRAEGLLGVAEQAWSRGEAVDGALALPLYLRDKVALTTAERLARTEGAR